MKKWHYKSQHRPLEAVDCHIDRDRYDMEEYIQYAGQAQNWPHQDTYDTVK